jgi:hypothetical protein
MGLPAGDLSQAKRTGRGLATDLKSSSESEPQNSGRVGKISELPSAAEPVYSSDVMKQILLLFFASVILWQSGCAVGPTIDEQSRQDQRDEQTVKQSDAFARSLSQ